MTVPTRYVLPVFLLIVFLGPVVLAPILGFALEPFGIPFHRVMSRAFLISAFAAIILFRRHLKIDSWWPRSRIALRQVRFGLLIAIVSSTIMIGLYFVFCGFDQAHLSFGRATLSILTAVVACMIVPLLEETLFRGFLITILSETTGRRVGLFLAALIFALAHFLRIPPENSGQHVHYWSGVTGVISALGQLGHGDFLCDRGLNLFLVGLILGGIFLRTGTLWVNAALHGGWIIILMSFTALTRPLTPPHVSWLGGDILSSPLTSLVLVQLGLWVWRFYQMPREGSRSMLLNKWGASFYRVV
jgi:membrane protease YdiL (CAAX protease family)